MEHTAEKVRIQIVDMSSEEYATQLRVINKLKDQLKKDLAGFIE